MLARIERLVPGTGRSGRRVDAFQERFTIPRDRLEPVMRAAIAECRRRTVEHIALPANERFTLEFVTGKSWGGYNWYKGDSNSLIQVNTDLPIRISRAVDLGCHEGYPGHHVLQHAARAEAGEGAGLGRVHPLSALSRRRSFIAEGSANYGVDLAFPGDERLAFETGILYPLAGLPAAEARALSRSAARRARSWPAPASPSPPTISTAGSTGRRRSSCSSKYQLVSPPRAEQSLAFIDQYRSYVINYGLGEDMVRAYVESRPAPIRRGGGRRWRKCISEPTLPSDLVIP